MNNHKLDVLEQQLQVLSGEVNGVLREMQVTIEGMAKTYAMAFRVFDSKIRELEARLGTKTELRPLDAEGKEI